MKCIKFTFFCYMIFQVLQAQSYINSLDSLIDKKVVFLGRISKKIKNIIYTVKTITKKELCLRQIDDFLERGGYVVDLSCLDIMALEAHLDIKNELQDLKNALYAKLYLYYLECAQQKMLYIAVKNYDNLWYWYNEKFEENKFFYQKNIFRWFLRSEYQIKVENNIALLQEVTKKTNSFLGLLKYNQRCLEQAQTQEEFQKSLCDAIQLQDECFYYHAKDEENYFDEDIIKKSTMQVYNFNQNICEQYGNAVLPSHIERHWQSYAVLATVICVSGIFCKKYEAEITQGTQYFWEHHVKRPFEQFKDIFSGLTHIPTLGTAPKFDGVSLEEDSKILEELIEVGAKIPQVNGQSVSLDQAIAELLHEASGGDFVKQYRSMLDIADNIKESIDKSQPILDKVNHSLEKIQPILNHELQQYEKFKKILPILKEHLVIFENKLAACKEKVQEEVNPNDWTNNSIAKMVVTTDDLVGAKIYLNSADAVTELVNNVIKTFDASGLMNGFYAEFHDENLKNTINPEDFKVNLATEEFKKNQKKLDEFSPVDYKPLPLFDTSNWTFEEKKQKALENDRIILAYPEKNIKNLAGAYHRVVMRQLVDTKEQMNKSIFQTNHVLDGIYRETNHLIEEVYTDNRLVLGVVALVPVATVCGSSLFASNKIYSSVAYRPIRKFIYQIEVLLNESFYASTCFEKEGSLYFLTEQLKLHIGVLTFAEQKLIKDDIASLQSANLDYVQKFNIVQRMYRTYPCLAIGIV